MSGSSNNRSRHRYEQYVWFKYNPQELVDHDWAIEQVIYFIISVSFSSSSDKLHMDSNCFRTVFTVSNFLTDSSNLFDQARFYPSGTIVLFLNLFVFELVLAILL